MMCKVQSLWVHQKWSTSHEFLLSGRANMAQYVFWGIIFSQNGKKSLRNLNNSQKTTWNKAQAIKLMMPVSLQFKHYCRTTKIFHNIIITVRFKSVTSPVTSKITWKYAVYKKQWPSWRNFLWNFIFDMREYITRGFWHQNNIWKEFYFL